MRVLRRAVKTKLTVERGTPTNLALLNPNICAYIVDNQKKNTSQTSSYKLNFLRDVSK